MALLVSIAIGFLIIRLSAKLPVRRLFQVSSWALVILATILVGKSARAFQELGYLPIHGSESLPTFQVLGIFASWEGLLIQGFVFVLCITLQWWLSQERNK